MIERSMAQDIRLFLQNEFARRARKNPRYSVSAFARALKIDVSTLSKVLNGKRRLGPLASRRLGLALGLNPAQIEALASATARNEGWGGLENTVAIAMDPRKLHDALEAVEWFRRKMNALLSKPGEESKTYLLSISFHAVE